MCEWHTNAATMDQYSTHNISDTLLTEIKSALKNVSPYGSVEIYVQDNTVTQITIRNIKKTINQTEKNRVKNNNQRQVLVV